MTGTSPVMTKKGHDEEGSTLISLRCIKCFPPPLHPTAISLSFAAKQWGVAVLPLRRSLHQQTWRAGYRDAMVQVGSGVIPRLARPLAPVLSPGLGGSGRSHWIALARPRVLHASAPRLRRRRRDLRDWRQDSAPGASPRLALPQ